MRRLGAQGLTVAWLLLVVVFGALAVAQAPAVAQVPEQTAVRVFYPGEDEQTVRLVPAADGASFRVNGGHLVWLTGAVLVRFAQGAQSNRGNRDAQIRRFLATAGVSSVQRLIGPYPTYRVTVRAPEDDIALANRLRRSRLVRWAHPDFAVTLHPAFTPNDYFFDRLWHLDNFGRYAGQLPGADISALEAWDLSRGTDVIVAVLDTGVDLLHEDLSLVPGYDFIDYDDDPSPVIGTTSYAHGTAVSGTAAAVGNNEIGVTGAAFEARVMPIRLIGESVTMSDVRAAFIWASDNGAAVLNNSWTFSAHECPDVPLYAAIKEGIDHATTTGRGGLGSVVLFGSGNGGCDITHDSLAAYEPVMAVGASDDTDHIFDYSAWGPWVDVVAPSGPGPDSPGSHQYLRTTDITGPDGYSEWSYMGDDAYGDNFWGTSASCPVVAGVAALVIAANPRMTEAEVRAVLQDTADKIDPTGGQYDGNGHSLYYGYGRVNAAAAVAAAINEPPPAPVVVSPSQGETIAPGLVTFRWEAVVDPDGDDLHYEVELYETSDATEPSLYWSSDELTDTSVTPGFAFVVGNQAAWRVWAVDRYGRGDEGDLVHFTVGLTDPGDDAGAARDGGVADDPGSPGCSCNQSTSLPSTLVLLLLLLLLGLVVRSPG